MARLQFCPLSEWQLWWRKLHVCKLWQYIAGNDKSVVALHTHSSIAWGLKVLWHFTHSLIAWGLKVLWELGSATVHLLFYSYSWISNSHQVAKLIQDSFECSPWHLQDGLRKYKDSIIASLPQVSQHSCRDCHHFHQLRTGLLSSWSTGFVNQRSMVQILSWGIDPLFYSS